jgi:hypothetical protein
VNYTLAKEKVREFGYMIMIKIYLFEMDHLEINIFEKLVRNNLVTAQINPLQIVKISQLSSNPSYVIKAHKQIFQSFYLGYRYRYFIKATFIKI